MTATGKLRIVVENLDTQEHSDIAGLADAVLHVVEGTDFSVFEIRMAMPRDEARAFLMGMLLGKMELSVEDVTALDDGDMARRENAGMN